MTVMESANWRNYRGYLIIARKTFFGRRRFGVWRDARQLDSFGDVVQAELHVDSLIGPQGPDEQPG